MNVTTEVTEALTECLSNLIADWNKYSQDWQPGGDCHDPEDGDNHTAMQVTFATRDGQQWAYQTGSTDFYGACYSLPCWATVWVDCDTNIIEAVQGIVDEWLDGCY